MNTGSAIFLEEVATMSKVKFWCVLGLLSAALAALAWAEEAPNRTTHPADEMPGLMRAKLASSQKVVEGLMSKDFRLIRKGADELSKICDATEWHASDDRVYAQYRAELQRTAKKLIQLAEEANFDGAAYAYMHSLTTCLSCHEYCRDVLRVAAKVPDLKAVPTPATDGAR